MDTPADAVAVAAEQKDQLLLKQVEGIRCLGLFSPSLSLSLYPYPIHIVAREAKSNTVCEDRR